MRTRTIVMAVALLSTACSWSVPCDSWYSPGECPDEGETGGEVDVSELFCHMLDHQCGITSTAGPINEAAIIADWGEIRDASECVSTSQPYPHVASWSVPVTDDYSGRLDMFCGYDQQDENFGTSITTEWTLCQGGAPTEYYPALEPVTVPETPSNTWTTELGCWTSPQSISTCDLVAIGTMPGGSWGTDEPHDPAEWTCSCESDADCQAGAVCELGWTLDNGFPGPTLCTWDAGDGTLNGIAQGGPSAYGFDDWSGVAVNGRDIGVTVDFLAAAIGIEQPSGMVAFGIFNDDQAVGGRALALGHPTDAAFNEVTHAGPSSLFRHVGLQVGDRIEADEDALDVLASSGQTTVDVRHTDGTVDEFTITMIEG